MKNEKILFSTNKLLLRAIELSYLAADEKEVESIDMTEVLYDELEQIPKNKELINMNINGKPGSGKSLVGITLANRIIRKTYNRKMTINDLARDQEEFIEMQKDGNVHDTCVMIDEWNQMEDTGENSTVEKALLIYMSDVQAQRNVHKISCSPTSSPDRNADIYLEVIQADKENMITHCRLIYKFVRAGMPIMQILGHVNIDVEEGLSLEWYQDYRRRKFEKMDLILKEGIFRPREMKYASVILEAVKRLKKLTELRIVTQDMVRTQCESEFRKAKLPTSIPGLELATRRAFGILTTWKAFYKLRADIGSKVDKMSMMSDDNPEKTNREFLKIEGMKSQLVELGEQAAQLEESYQRMIDIKKKYDDTKGDGIDNRRDDVPDMPVETRTRRNRREV